MKKLKKNGGFTLVEMLIVVAIIAILIAVSIPLINSSLEKARHSVDNANIRDATSLTTVWYLEHQDDVKGNVKLTYYVNSKQQGKVFVSDAGTGNGASIKAATEDEIGDYKPVEIQCKQTAGGDGCWSGKSGALEVTVGANGDISTVSWGDFHGATAAK